MKQAKQKVSIEATWNVSKRNGISRVHRPTLTNVNYLVEKLNELLKNIYNVLRQDAL